MKGDFDNRTWNARCDEYESHIRACLASKAHAPCQGRSLTTNAAIIRWLENLRTARTSWESLWLKRLKALSS